MLQDHQIDLSEHKIMQMEPEKRQRVLSAAMEEFSHGYEYASTDRIVNQAGISKGLLFHYFGTKLGLYEFILSYILQKIEEEFSFPSDQSRVDLLEHLWQLSLHKRNLVTRYPAMFECYATAYREAMKAPDDAPHKAALNQLLIHQKATSWKIYQTGDPACFKDGIDPTMAFNIIRWTMEGYGNEVLAQGKTLAEYQLEYEAHLAQLRLYFDLLRNALYRPES